MTDETKCLKCGAWNDNLIHDGSCMECGESFCSSRLSGSAADVRVFIAENLPCYDRKNGDDDFFYIASANDIEKCAFALWKKFIKPIA